MKRVMVHCSRQLRVIHFHPQLPQEEIDKRPHLGQPHEHTFKVTIGLRVNGLDREKDLLHLHTAMEAMCSRQRDMGSSSFERICDWVKTQVPDAYLVRLEERDEGAEIIYQEGWL